MKRPREGVINRQTNRQTDRQTDRQTNRQTASQIDTDSNVQKNRGILKKKGIPADLYESTRGGVNQALSEEKRREK